MTTHLWCNDNGTIYCAEHAGSYLRSAITARPKAKTHRTPLGNWVQMDGFDIAVFIAETGITVLCETCRDRGCK